MNKTDAANIIALDIRVAARRAGYHTITKSFVEEIVSEARDGRGHIFRYPHSEPINTQSFLGQAFAARPALSRILSVASTNYYL